MITRIFGHWQTTAMGIGAAALVSLGDYLANGSFSTKGAIAAVMLAVAGAAKKVWWGTGDTGEVK